MTIHPARLSTALGLTLAACLALAPGLGCGGGSESVDDATVTVREPGEAIVDETGATDEAASAAPGAGPSAATTPAAGKAAVEEGWGTLKGQVTFAGDPPKLPPLIAQGDSGVKDAQVCAADGVPDQRLVVDPESKGVQWAIVYIPRPTAVNPEAASEAQQAVHEFDQQGCLFLPHSLAAMKGSKVLVKSSDPIAHNVNAVGLLNTRFNTSIQPGQDLTVDLRTAEIKPGEVVCDIHPWMKSWWLVANNPYFAVTDEQGRYEIHNVPAGAQKVVVWQEAVPGFVTASSGDEVRVEADGETTKDFVIEAAKVKL